jgi:sugar phosphate isomerase/epimerase
MSHTIPEPDVCRTRRHVLKTAGVLAAGAAAAFAGKARASETPSSGPQPSPAGTPGSPQAPAIRIGVLLGTFPGPTFEARLDAVKASGLDCVQLSMDCAGLPAMPDEIAPELAARVRREAAARAITIASLHGTFNMSHPDPEHRRTGLRQLRVLAEACRELGTSVIHLCTGTRDREDMWRRHPDNDLPEAWRDLTACMREAVEIARQTRVVLAFEPEVNNVVDSAQKARRLIDEIGSDRLKVTIDGANVFHKGELAHMDEVLDRTFQLLGKDIVVAHAKDLDHDGDAGHLPAGQGRLNYERYLSLLLACKFKGSLPLLLHGLSAAQVPGCAAFLREKLARVIPASAGAR